MSAADRLREAADVLRERAEAAAESEGGSWHASGRAAYVIYVDTMHPGVALALADWLDREALTADYLVIGDQYPSMRVANLILGGAS